MIAQLHVATLYWQPNISVVFLDALLLIAKNLIFEKNIEEREDHLSFFRSLSSERL